MRPFHLAIPVHDLEAANSFYSDIMGFTKGRSSNEWIDWNCYGHQLVTHLDPNYQANQHVNDVDNKAVPIPHFGVVLDMSDWKDLAERLKKHGTEFVVEPYIRFEGQAGEQATMFFMDPSGNALEFKAFESLDQLFAV